MSFQPDSDGGSLRGFLAYSFATDAEYQQGLAGISSSGVLDRANEQARDDIILRSEVFYYNRLTGASVDVDEAREARRSSSSKSDVPAGADESSPPHPPDGSEVVSPPPAEDEPQTLSFTQLKELIEQGKTDQIPNNKTIPNVYSADPPSESKATIRKKPWETQPSA